MSRLGLLYRSQVGKKAIVAGTGAMLLGFLVLHVIGNLKVFVADPVPGVPDIDVYARFLRTMAEPVLPHMGGLWIVRGILGVALALHIICVLQLAAMNRRARPIPYAHTSHVHATKSARWMLYTGSLLLVFVVIHLLQFTTGSIDSERFTEGAVYGNLHRAFQVGGYVAGYIVAMAVLGLHLYHGAWSLFQSLGSDNPDRNPSLRRTAVVLAVGLFIAFASVPTAFFVGAMKPPPAITAALGGAR